MRNSERSTMPETMSVERRNLVKAYGATVKLTPGKQGMAGAILAAEELRDATPGSIILQQFENPANPQAHYNTTGVEIWEQTEGNVDLLTEDYIRTMKRDLPNYTFMVSILNVKIKKSNDGFYSNLDIDHVHGYIPV